MLERRRLIISMILIINLCVLFWRVSWQDVNVSSSQSKSINYDENGYGLRHGRRRGDGNVKQQRQINMLGNQLWNEGNANQTITIDASRLSINETPDSVPIRTLEPILPPTQTPDDPNRLIDLIDFKYKIQNSACSSNIRALVVVHSAPENHFKRALIRETWANKSLLRLTPLRVLFFLGTVKNNYLQERLVKESVKYGDIVQGNFLDNYRNLTYKHVMAFKWFLYNCPDAKLLIKVDDDIFVNTPQILKYARGGTITIKGTASSSSASLSSLFPFTTSNSPTQQSIDIELFNKPHGLLICKRQNDAQVRRSFRSKWRVSFKEYTKKLYPPYCLGFGIIYSKDVVAKLYASAQNHEYFWIDDVHITGILTQLNGINITDCQNNILSDKQYKDLALNKDKVDFKKWNEILFSAHDISALQMEAVWKIVKPSMMDFPPTAATISPSTTVTVNVQKYSNSQTVFNEEHPLKSYR